jgi:ABC-2 type transport system ATP-binding protein
LQAPNAIEIINLTKTFKTKYNPNGNGASFFKRGNSVTVKAVNNLNLTIESGKLFGLLGPNGAGKTTLVKMLCTLLPPDGGTALINGYDVRKQQMQVKRSLGTLFSVGERGFFWRLNGYRNLEFYASIYNVPRARRQQRIMEVLKLVQLENSAFDLYQRYSGGMKRKLALARTLLPDPPILLLDEPTTGLDVISSRNIRDFVKNTVSKESGKTVLYTTHYIEEAAQICDQIGILKQGQLIACDTPDNIRAMIKRREIVHLTLENITQAQIEEIRGVEGVVNLTAEKDTLLNQTEVCLELKNLNNLTLIFDFLSKNTLRLINFKRDEPTLEDAFIELTRRQSQ